MLCKNCKEKEAIKYSECASGNFCSRSCANSYSAKQVKGTKKVNCITCGKELEVDIRSSPKQCKCDDCKIHLKYLTKNGKFATKERCTICGEFKCKRKDICKHFQIFPSLITYFGFDQNKLRTIQVYEEYERIKNLLIEEYYNNKLSTLDIENKYGYSHQSISQRLFKAFDIISRTSSESVNNAIIQGKPRGNGVNQYKCGWYTTWNNKQIFYRSSYELDYCKELDVKQIDYEVEKLRILYWDSQLLKQRTAIPDFYLPNINEIIEIKSDYTYDEQNMKDKFKAYKEHGYKVKLILEHKEIHLC